VHLSELAKATSSNPLLLLQSYKKGKAAGFPESFQYADNVQHAGTKRGQDQKKAAPSKAVPVEVESFDTFEDIEQRLANESNSAGEGVVRGKASRFQA
jgi:hypothetical protein